MNTQMNPIFPKENRYLILDWSNVTHRAIAVSTDTTFVKRLLTMLANYRKSYVNWEFIFTLEGSGSANRRTEFEQYKAQRVHTEKTLEHVDTAITLLNYCKGRQVKCPEGEADDAIASFIQQRAGGNRVVIVTEDTDMWQLIQHNRITVKSSRVGDVTPEVCRQKQGVLPHSVILKKALVGDKSDNIPKGVPRIGNKTLTEVARKSRDLHGLKALVKSGELGEKLSTKIKDNRHTVIQNVGLIRLKSDLDVIEKKSEADLMGAIRFLEGIGVAAVEEKLVAKAVGAPEARRTL